MKKKRRKKKKEEEDEEEEEGEREDMDEAEEFFLALRAEFTATDLVQLPQVTNEETQEKISLR